MPSDTGSTAAVRRTPGPSWRGHGSPETTPRGTSRVYRVYSRYYGAGTLRSSEGVPLISGVGAVGWFVPDGVGVWAGWCRRVPGGRLDGDMGVPTPTCSPIPLMGRGLGWSGRRRQPRAAPREWHSIYCCCFGAKSTSRCCVTYFGMMFGSGLELVFCVAPF